MKFTKTTYLTNTIKFMFHGISSRRYMLLIGLFLLFVIFHVRSITPTAEYSNYSNENIDWLHFEGVLISRHECKGSCVFENVCINKQYTLEYYLEDETSMKKLPTLNLIAGRQDYWDKGHVNILNVSLLKPERKLRYIFSAPIYMQKMIAMGNFGHAILQNVYPLLKMAVNTFGEQVLKESIQTLLLNNCKNCGWPSETCKDGQGSYGYSSCGFMKDQLYSHFTGKNSIDFAQFLKDQNQSELCFRKLVIGFDDNDDMLSGGADSLDLLVKDFGRKKTLESLKIPGSLEMNDKIIIAVYCKKAGRHGGGIANCDYIKDVVSKTYNNVFKDKIIEVTTVNFDTLSDMLEQFRIVSKAHIYISSGGSASYYSLFLKKGTVAMILPQCSLCKCFDLFPGARLNINTTYMAIKPSSIICPVNDCSADCNAQNLPLGDGFIEELKIAIENVYNFCQNNDR